MRRTSCARQLRSKKAAPKKQSTTKTSTGKKHMGSMEAGDRNIVMQLRKAQDLKGNHDIIVSPKGRTVRLPKTMIDKLLKRFDSLQQLQDKKRLPDHGNEGTAQESKMIDFFELRESLTRPYRFTKA